MKKLKWKKNYKRCPRCNNKCLLAQAKCEECGLVFERLQYISNKAAKKKILKFDTDYVLYTTKYPADLKWWKVLLICTFLGIFGGHYYYVGKYWKGAVMTAFSVLWIFCGIFNDVMFPYLENGLYLPIGFAGLLWIISLCFVMSRRFKVPVIAVPPEDYEALYKPKTKEKKKKADKTDDSVEAIDAKDDQSSNDKENVVNEDKK